MKPESQTILDEIKLTEIVDLIQKLTIQYEPYFTQGNIKTLENLMSSFRAFESMIKKYQKGRENA